MKSFIFLLAAICLTNVIGAEETILMQRRQKLSTRRRLGNWSNPTMSMTKSSKKDDGGSTKSGKATKAPKRPSTKFVVSMVDG